MNNIELRRGLMLDMESKTYKFSPPEDISPHAGYFTIAGDPPEAFFINSKDMKSFQWITALMTSWSRQLEADVPIMDIIDDMKETFQPGGINTRTSY